MFFYTERYGRKKWLKTGLDGEPLLLIVLQKELSYLSPINLYMTVANSRESYFGHCAHIL